MTPTLIGRWQTRILLLTLVGFPITLPLTLGWIGPGANSVFSLILLYVLIFGLLWDVVYHFGQQFRWDNDWPGVLQLLTGIGEGVFLGAIAKSIPLPGLVPEEISLKWFCLHYTCVWFGVYLASQSFTRILFPRWRFRGGRWLS